MLSCGSEIMVQYHIIHMVHMSAAVQSQKAVSAYFTVKKIPPFGFAE